MTVDRHFTSPTPVPRRRSAPYRYGAATLLAALAVALLLWLRPAVGEAPFFVPLTAAVVVAAWFGGLGPGLVVVAIGAVASARMVAGPTGNLVVSNEADLLRIAVFTGAGILLTLIIDGRNRAVRLYAEQREWWRVSLASVGDGVIVTNPAGHITFMNELSEQLTGWSRTEAAGRPLPDVFRIVNEETRQPAENPVARVLATGRVVGLANHTLLLRRDGSEISLDDNAAPVRDEDGRLLGVVLIYRDVTAKRESERTLQRQADSLRLQAELLDHAYDAVFVRGENDQITYWNSASADLYGWTGPEAMGRNAHELLQTRFADGLEQVNQALRQDGHWSGEVVHMTRDGRSVTVDSREVLIAGPQPGHGVILEINRDVTSRKLARQREAMLLDASSLLSSSLDSDRVLKQLTRVVVPALADWCVVDLLQADDSVRRVAGSHRDGQKQAAVDRLVSIAPSGQAPGAEAMRAASPVLIPLVEERSLDAMAHDDEDRMLLQSLRPRSFMAVPLFARGRTVGAITFARADSGRRYTADDVTLAESVARRAGLAIDNARLYQEAQQANRVKDEFLATLSHELRTPLNAIRGWTQMLLTGRLDPDTVQRAYATIDRNAQAQTQLITDILDVSRIITGKLRLDPRPLDLVGIVEDALESVRPAATARGVHLEARYDTTPARMFGDRDRLQQVFWNLLSNAVKFTPVGGRVFVSLASSGSGFEVRVTDTGVGIRREFLPHVFERFTQSDASASRAYGGLGLGLAISRHLAELHGGTIVADSAGEGQGATFAVTLPVHVIGSSPASGGAATARDPAVDVPELPALDGITVLVIDDEADARDLLAAVLRQHGAEVLLADSSADARRLLQTHRPAVIVSDIGMPEEDGYAFIRALRASSPDLGADTPAVAVTAYARQEDRLRALEAGYQQHIAKPVAPAELVVVVAALARARRPRPVAG